MPVTVIGLMGFVHELRSDFFEAAATLGEREFVRDQGVSLGSYRNIFLHLAYVEEHHVTQFCEGRATVWPPFSRQVSNRRFRGIASVRERLAAVTDLATERYRAWDTPKGRGATVRWVRLGHPVRLSRENALAQCVTEQLLHLGEIEAMLWQHDIEPPTTFWIDRWVLRGRPPAPPPVPVLRKVARLRAAATAGRGHRRPP